MKKSITLFGQVVPIKTFTPDETNQHYMGYCSKRPLEIFINDSLSKHEQEFTLCHELIHAFLFRLGFDQVLSHEMQEMLAENIAEVLVKNFKFKN